MTGDSSAVIIDTSSGHKPTEMLVIEQNNERVETRDAARLQKALLNLDNQKYDSADDDLFGEEDAPVFVKSESS